MKIGVKRRTVKVVDYDFNWLNEYIKEETVLKKILSNYDVDIQHIGSTSIIGCKAKPINRYSHWCSKS